MSQGVVREARRPMRVNELLLLAARKEDEVMMSGGCEGRKGGRAKVELVEFALRSPVRLLARLCLAASPPASSPRLRHAPGCLGQKREKRHQRFGRHAEAILLWSGISFFLLDVSPPREPDGRLEVDPHAPTPPSTALGSPPHLADGMK